MEERKGFTASEKKTMLLSDETATGLKLTGTHKTLDVMQLEELSGCINNNCIFILCSEIIHSAGTIRTGYSRCSTLPESKDITRPPGEILWSSKAKRPCQ